VRPTRLLFTLTGFAVALLLVASTTGAGWTVVVVCCVAATIAAGTAWPALAIRRVSVTVVMAADATAGRDVTGTLAVEGTRSPLRVRLATPPGPWVGAVPPVTGEVTAVPERRGVIPAVEVDVEVAAPLGLMWWRRHLRVPLDRPLEVAPAPLEEPIATTELAARPGGEAVRSLREYRPGDPARLVHWPSTAKRGQLVVKELEEPDRPGVVLQVDLRGDPVTAEQTAGRAMGAALGALRAGLSVTLLTAEAGGPRAGIVRTPIEAGRRLARATDAAPPDGPVPDGVAVIRIGGYR
jgi:uncharacterized protein (DUF58 family)